MPETYQQKARRCAAQIIANQCGRGMKWDEAEIVHPIPVAKAEETINEIIDEEQTYFDGVDAGLEANNSQVLILTNRLRQLKKWQDDVCMCIVDDPLGVGVEHTSLLRLKIQAKKETASYAAHIAESLASDIGDRHA